MPFDYRFAFSPGDPVTTVAEAKRDLESDSQRRVGKVKSCRVSMIDGQPHADYQVRYGADDFQWVPQDGLIYHGIP